MKIIHVPRRFVTHSWGGTETVVLQTCRALKQLGHEAEIWCPSCLSEPGVESIEGVTVRRFSYFYPFLGLTEEGKQAFDYKGGNLFSWSMLWALLREPEVTHFHLHTAKRLGSIVRTVARLRNLPYVVSLHGGLKDIPQSEEESFVKPGEKALEWGKALGFLFGSRKVVSGADGVLCLSQEEASLVGQELSGGRSYLVPNGVDVERFKEGDGKAFRERFQISQEAFVVLVVGRIDPQKNQVLALKLARQFTNIHLLLIGHVTHPGYCEKVKQEIEEGELGGRVTLIQGLDGNGQELVDAYHAANTFLLPSIHEPFGVVILEAWSAGLPVLASRVGGVPGFVEDGVNGLLFEVDSLDSAAQQLKRILNDPKMTDSLGREGQKKARTAFSWRSVTEQVVGIYQDARSLYQ
jgi:glycosyltransferase involved in cell wall biosynthesis